MKYVKSIIWSFLAAGLLFSACTEEEGYQPAEKESGAGVYFADMSASVKISMNDESFQFSVMRYDATEKMDVALKATLSENAEGLFELPAAASFAEGEKVATVDVAFDPAELEFDTSYTIQVDINDPENTTLYGYSAKTFTVTLPSPWTSLGMATYCDEWFELKVNVEIEQNDLNPKQFRLANPYIAMAEQYEGVLAADGFSSTDIEDEYLQFRLLAPGDTVGDVEITMENLVFYNIIHTGQILNQYASEVWAVHPYNFGYDEADWACNRVVSYQANGLPAVVNFASYYYMNGVGGWDYTDDEEGTVNIIFPGVVLADTDVELEYEGRLVTPDESNYAVVNVTLGADVEEVRVAIGEGKDAQAVYDAIVAGQTDCETLTKSGQAKLPVDDGTWTIVAVSYLNGEPQKYDYVTFKVTLGAAETWSLAGTGVYESWWYAGDEDEEPFAFEGQELYQSDVTPNRYKIANWCEMGVDFVFTFDEQTGDVVIEDQWTGEEDYWVDDYSNWADFWANYDYEADEYASYYEDGVFCFGVQFYTLSGDLYYPMYEYFTLDGEAEAAATRAAVRVAKPAMRNFVEVSPQIVRNHSLIKDAEIIATKKGAAAKIKAVSMAM